MSQKPPTPIRQAPKNIGTKIAIFASRFNQEIVDELLHGCVNRLAELGVKPSNTEIRRVPGAFELPVAAKLAAQSKKFDAIICLGAVIRGETPHFDLVAGEAARGIQQAALDTGIPIIFGVLATNAEQQAKDRLDSGLRAAEAAIEMATLASEFKKQDKSRRRA